MVFQRRSRQREVILEELRAVTTHPTAEQLHERVRHRIPKISLGTIYRNLDLMARHGLVRKLDSGGGQARFDGDLTHHLHVRCVQCGQVADVAVGPEGPDSGPIEACCGYEILGLRVEYVGICPACGERLSEEEREQMHRNWV